MKKITLLTLILTMGTGAIALSPDNPKVRSLCQQDKTLTTLSSNLLQAQKQLREGKTLKQALQDFDEGTTRKGRLRCLVGVTEFSDDFFAACKAAGVKVEETYQRGNLRQVNVSCTDPRQLESLAKRDDVRGITSQPIARKRAGLVNNQADEVLRTAEARALFGVSGAGVRIGVLSDSIADTIGGSINNGFLTGSDPQNSGDLPTEIRIIDQGPGDGIDEGAGMMELIYDLAPGSDLSFASAFTGYGEFAENIVALAKDPGYECDIIVDDVIYFEEPIYQDGPIALAAEEAYAAGALIFSSAGNEADDAHERTFVDINPAEDNDTFPPTGDDLHDFGTAYGQPSKTHLQVNLDPDDTLLVILHWDEPYGGTLAEGPGSETDLDVYIVSNTDLPMDLDTNVLALGSNFQGIEGSPLGDSVEVASYDNTSLKEETVYVAIDHYDGRKPVNLHLELLVYGTGTIVDKDLLQDRTIWGHPAAADTMAVAAVFYDEVATDGNTDLPRDVINVEPYSSLGGLLPIWFTSDGAIRYEQPQLRFKPEIAAVDGTNTTFFGDDIAWDTDYYPNFFGTSASSPHAAGVAALLKGKYPDLPPRELYRILMNSAVDIEDTGADYLSGKGLLSAVRALSWPTQTGTTLWILDGYGQVWPLE